MWAMRRSGIKDADDDRSEELKSKSMALSNSVEKIVFLKNFFLHRDEN